MYISKSKRVEDKIKEKKKERKSKSYLHWSSGPAQYSLCPPQGQIRSLQDPARAHHRRNDVLPPYYTMRRAITTSLIQDKALPSITLKLENKQSNCSGTPFLPAV